MLDKSASENAHTLESFVRSRADAKRTLGQLSSEITKGGRFNDRAKAMGYLQKWAKEYEDDRF